MPQWPAQSTHKGRPYPIQAASRGFGPIRCSYPWLGRVLTCNVVLCRTMTENVGKSRKMSEYDGVFPFFLTYMLVFAEVSSLSFVGYGQSIHGHFTDLQRPFFAFRFSVSESSGFTRLEQSHLNSDSIAAHEGRPQGAPLPIRAAPRGLVPVRQFL